MNNFKYSYVLSPANDCGDMSLAVEAAAIYLNVVEGSLSF